MSFPIKLDFNRKHVKHIEIEEYENYIYLESLVVKEEFRGQGVGSAILSEVVGYAKSRDKPLLGFASAELGGDIDKLKGWYRRMGFREGRDSVNCAYNYNIMID